MAEAAGVGATPLHRGIPDEIAIWEVLVRLPPESLLRCRAVCRAWRRATSTRDFLLAHHDRQPTLPIIHGYSCVGDEVQSKDIIHFDYRAAAAQLQLQLQPVARLDEDSDLYASCDGLLLLSHGTTFPNLCICNPATRQYAPLPMLAGFMPLGMYLHGPTAEYRILLYDECCPMDSDSTCYIFALGSVQLPRCVGSLLREARQLCFISEAVLFDGSLHWHVEECKSRRNTIVVFNTTAESFRYMLAPVACGHANLFEMDGILGMSSFNDAKTIIDIWMMQDYVGEVWAFKYRVELPVAEIRIQFEMFNNHLDVMVVPGDGVLLMLVRFAEWLLHVDINGKLVASFHRKGLRLTQSRLQQTLVSHTFFPTLDGYSVNAWPFI